MNNSGDVSNQASTSLPVCKTLSSFLEFHMLFMIIERFKDNDMVPIYRQVRDGSRKLPDGLKYIDSWIEPNFSRCFQLMECDDLRLFQKWVLEWRGFGVVIEIVPVVGSKETQAEVAPYLNRPTGNDPT